MSRVLTPDEVTALLEKPSSSNGYPPPLQFGPIRFTDIERRCISSGYYIVGLDGKRVWHKTKGACGSPTTHLWKGLPLCVHHILDRANELLFELGVEK